jgi:hypothetical protein
LHALWASADANLVLAAGSNTIARLQGNDWIKESIPIVPQGSGFKDIWGTSAPSVYAVGGDFNSNTMTTSNALAYVSDGTSWSAITFNLPELADKGWRLEAVWARSASEVYVAGGVWQLKNNTWDTRWLLMVYDGTAWKILPPPSGANIDREIMALRGDDQHLYVSDWQNIWVYDGATWTIECPGKMTFGFAFGANGEVLGYGPDGLFLRP